MDSLRLIGGEGGIRTPETLSSLHAFQACALSRTLPPLRGEGSVCHFDARIRHKPVVKNARATFCIAAVTDAPTTRYGKLDGGAATLAGVSGRWAADESE